ncbi:MAG: DUF5615 family PIN-like protein [Candidatus Odinarchaeota archaeon]|nr:DUF5615 family PIN-like protein [Candidatus Odinarchaeota archaeon]
MKFLADENIPLKVVKELEKIDVDILSISLLYPGITDLEVTKIAREQQRIIITFDKDFGHLIFRENYKVPGIILLRIPMLHVEYIFNKIKQVIFNTKIDFYGKFVVVSEGKIRVIKMEK